MSRDLKYSDTFNLQIKLRMIIPQKRRRVLFFKRVKGGVEFDTLSQLRALLPHGMTILRYPFSLIQFFVYKLYVVGCFHMTNFTDRREYQFSICSRLESQFSICSSLESHQHRL